jgi:hypothetical protein
MIRVAARLRCGRVRADTLMFRAKISVVMGLRFARVSGSTLIMLWFRTGGTDGDRVTAVGRPLGH